MNLIRNARFLCASRSSDAGSTANNSHVVDMQGFNSVLFIGKAGCEWESTAITVNIYGSTVSTTAGSNLIEATTCQTAAVAASSQNDRLFLVDLVKPASTYRYYWAQVYSDSTHRFDWLSIQYDTRRGGTTDLYDSTTIAHQSLLVGQTS